MMANKVNVIVIISVIKIEDKGGMSKTLDKYNFNFYQNK
jgi:hypothetical protein